jgi:hypothetical protein
MCCKANGRRTSRADERDDGGRRWRKTMEEGDGGRRWRKTMEEVLRKTIKNDDRARREQDDRGKEGRREGRPV